MKKTVLLLCVLLALLLSGCAAVGPSPVAMEPTPVFVLPRVPDLGYALEWLVDLVRSVLR
jgi:hypothetical protein